MRVLLDCGSCGSVAVRPEDLTVLTYAGPPAEALFDCPVCARVGAAPMARTAVTVLLGRGATAVAEPGDREAPLGLADLRSLQVLLAADHACPQALGRALES